MARPKRNSRVLTQAEQREAGLRTIDQNLKLSDELTLSDYRVGREHESPLASVVG